jgi:serine protease Do
MPHPRFLGIVVIGIGLIASSKPAHAQPPPSDYLRSHPKFVQIFREVVQPYAPCIVRVQCDGADTCLGTIVGADGWMLAKAHDLAGKITCKLNDGRQFEAKLVGVHERHDLALLKIAAQQLRVIQFSHSKNAKAGSWVVSVGWRADAAAVGVVSVPTRKVHEAYLGVLADSSPRGLIVLGVAQKSAAFQAGLRPKDIILHPNSQPVADADQFQQILADLKPGDAIALKIKRGAKEHEFRATLQSREQVGDFRTEFQNRLGSDLSNRRSGYAVILQHDSDMKPSDCGGPVVDLQGRVIGINISRAGRVESWAIPAEIVHPLIAELKSSKLAPKEKKAE